METPRQLTFAVAQPVTTQRRSSNAHPKVWKHIRKICWVWSLFLALGCPSETLAFAQQPNPSDAADRPPSQTQQLVTALGGNNSGSSLVCAHGRCRISCRRAGLCRALQAFRIAVIFR
jgi:hypothetical protein